LSQNVAELKPNFRRMNSEEKASGRQEIRLA